MQLPCWVVGMPCHRETDDESDRKNEVDCENENPPDTQITITHTETATPPSPTQPPLSSSLYFNGNIMRGSKNVCALRNDTK